MERTKGSLNRKKAAAADREVTTDHNSAAMREGLTEDQRRSLLLTSVADYKQALAEKKKYDKLFKDACQKIKADGVKLSSIKTAIQLETPEGVAAVKADLEDTVRVAAYMQAEVGTQFSFFRDDGDGEDNASYRAGKEAGLAGIGSVDIPRQWDTKLWMDGWSAGQEVHLSMFKEKKAGGEKELEDATSGANEF